MYNHRASIHNHTFYSNLRLLDALSSPEDLIDKALKLGIDMIGISDHESLSAHIRINKYAQELKEKYPNFKIALGNEIYLTETRDKNQPYFHFILVAKDAIGHQMLREMSSIAWLNSYYDRGMQRVPLLYQELEQTIKKYGKGHLISSSACIGSSLGYHLLQMRDAEQIGDKKKRKKAHDKIVEHVLFCKKNFDTDFYFEIAPALYEDQIYVNKKTLELCNIFDVKATIQDDSHRVSQDDYLAHKALLNSKQGEREDIDSFYQYTYLQSYEDIRKHMEPTGCNCDELFKNSMEMYDKVEVYSLLHPQQVPTVPVTNYPKKQQNTKYKNLDKLYNSNNDQERYWVNYCVDKLKEKNLFNNIYLQELDNEAEVQIEIGKKLDTCIFSYPIFLQHYFDLIWECGSCVGVGRGCFQPGSKVLMNNGKNKNIEDVEVGDFVFSKEGKIQKVENVLSYDCNEVMYKITNSTFTSQPIYATNNHEFWVMEGGPCHLDRTYCSKNCIRQCSKNKASFIKKWKSAENLQLSDYIFYPKPTFSTQKIYSIDLANYIYDSKHYIVTKNSLTSNYGNSKSFDRYIEIDKEFLYILGVAIGDGWTKADLNHFGIAFNSDNQKDLESLEKCKSYFDKKHFTYSIVKHKHKKLLQLKIFNTAFARFMREAIGENSLSKQIPDWALYDNKEDMLSLFFGLMASDGSYDKKSLRIAYDSINLDLISQIKILWGYLGIYGGIVYRKPQGNNKESYKLRASGKQLNWLIPKQKLIYQKSSNIQKDLIIEPEGFFVKIKNIEKVPYNGKVYDLTVQNDHSYIINHIAVHNSSGAGLDNYLMGLTQYDCIAQGVNNYFRYLNKNREELPDLDFDLAPTVRPKWFQKIREERGDLGLVQVCTFSTMSSRAAILSACRGYRSEKYPEGIDNDEAQYLTSLVGSNRGFTYTIKDMIEGNPKKDLKPNKTFLKELENFPGLLDIIKKLEGVISNRSIHASGIVFNDKGHEFDNCAIMTAPDGTLITQWSLRDQEAAGKTKIDSLVTDVMEKITQCIQLLQKHNKIDPKLSLREAYDKYLHPDVLPLEDSKIWDAIDNLQVHNLFQFDTQVGSQAVKKLKPRNVKELSAINALIRLMAQEKGAETPVDRYFRIQNNPQEWIDEMSSYGLTEKEQSVIQEYCGHTYGTLPLQDDLMLMMMDERLFGFDLETTNSARKIIGKKLMDKIPKLHEQVLEKAKSPAIGEYVWNVLFSEQLGYAFNAEHTLSYSMIGVQCAYLATYFPDVYWNTACLRVDAGLEEEAATNYGKIAKAVGNMIANGIHVSLVDINNSEYGFEPDEKNNSILYGLKSLNGVGGEVVQEIIKHRPYSSWQDFLSKVKANKTVMVSLIKAGAFDQFGERKNIMKEYIWSVCEPKKRITLQNFNGLIEKNLVPQELAFEKRVFMFNKLLKKKFKSGDYFLLSDDYYYNFYAQYFDIDLLEPYNGTIAIQEKEWKKIYNKAMEPAKNYFKEHQKEILNVLNDKIFQESWDKYAAGTYSDWEMDSLGMYYHDHSLAHIDLNRYDIVEFNDLAEEPIVDYTFKRNGVEIPIFKTFRIAGTVIAKDDAHSSISLLTIGSGVVTVKMGRDYFAKYNRRISEIMPDGTKKVREVGWFQKGTLVIFNGFRRNNMFVEKTYKKSLYHGLYKITAINNDGSLESTWRRYGEEEEDE